MHARTAVVAIAMSFSMIGCARSGSAARPSQPATMAAEAAPSPPAVAPSPAVATTSATAKTDSRPDATVANAMVIYTGEVSMLEEAEKISALVDKIVDLAEGQGGRLQARRDDGVTIRVPSARFRDTLRKIDSLGIVTHRSVKAEEVSEEYHDAEVRLLNLKATRQRLQDFLAKATNIAETLTVERELERIAVEIDRLQGRMRFLQDRASLSTIDVQVAAKPRPAITVAASTTPARRGIQLPIRWLAELDVDHLSNFNK